MENHNPFMKLPFWDDVFAKSKAGEKLTALEQFIFEWEPHKKDAKWRAQLFLALDWAFWIGKED